MTTKKIRLRKRYKILLSLIFIFTIAYTYLCYIEPNCLAVHEYKITSAKLPNSFHGTKIVHISDIHYGRTIKEKQLKRIVTEINKINPDMVVFTGDLIDEDITLTTKMTNILVRELSSINASLGKYAISGNHDDHFSSYATILDKSAFILLDNNYNLIYNAGYEPIFIGGINTNEELNLDKTMLYFNQGDETKNIDNIYTIVLLHMPDYTDALLDEYKVDLVLAGHSHNGQIKLPYLKPFFTPTYARKYYNAYYQIDNTDLYVSSGLGTSLISARAFNTPSFNLYRLNKSK